MSDRWGRWASLTGVLFAVVAVVGALIGGESPETSASAARIVAYYVAHRSDVEASNIVFAIGFLLVVIWASVLRSYLRRSPGAEGLSALVLAGGVLMAAGALVVSGIEYGIAHNIHNLGPESVKTLNFLSFELFLPVLGGAFLFAIGSGVAILRGAPLPKWLGWVVIVLGIAVLVPPISFFALFGFAIWSVIVSILIFIRLGRIPAAGMPAPQPAS
jgi:hypothetical protein